MLYKGASQTARDAVFGEPGDADFDNMPVETIAVSEPSPDALEIARLTAENEILRRERAQQKDEWAEALLAAETRAREQAANDHVQDDGRRTAQLIEVTTQARKAFDHFLESAVGVSTARLAARAFSRLVEISADDEDWLQRVVTRRIAELGSQAEVVLHLPPDLCGSIESGHIAGTWPAGCKVVPDRNLSPGTAIIRLSLGEIRIDPRDGAAKIADLLVTDLSDA